MGRVLARGPTGRPGTRDDGALPDRLLATRHHVRTSHAPQGRGGHTVASVNIKPLEDKIVVQANEAETTTASGIVIPDTAKEKPQEGTVLAVGPGRIDDNGNRIPIDVVRSATSSSTRSTAAPRSSTAARSTCSCRRATSWPGRQVTLTAVATRTDCTPRPGGPHPRAVGALCCSGACAVGHRSPTCARISDIDPRLTQGLDDTYGEADQLRRRGPLRAASAG